MRELTIAASAVRASVYEGVAVARQLHSGPLLASVHAAFVHGMDVALLVSAAIAAAGILLTLAFLPGRAARTGTQVRTENVDGENLLGITR